MIETRIPMPIPPALDPATLADARYSLAVATDRGEVLAHYDPARQLGAAFTAAAATWSTWWPLTFDQFVGGLARLRIREAPGFAAWAAACDPAGTASRTQ